MADITSEVQPAGGCRNWVRQFDAVVVDPFSSTENAIAVIGRGQPHVYQSSEVYGR
eukprot:m.375590 g.375590  ORF g.375590 m.375590 type:complete len:56 (+) comp16699_c0_seq15:162-329(+)